MPLTAYLKTVFPSCLMKCSLLSMDSADAGILLPPPGTIRYSPPEPSICKIESIIPFPLLVGSKITPPPPSPKITQVSLS